LGRSSKSGETRESRDSSRRSAAGASLEKINPCRYTKNYCPPTASLFSFFLSLPASIQHNHHVQLLQPRQPPSTPINNSSFIYQLNPPDTCETSATALMRVFVSTFTSQVSGSHIRPRAYKDTSIRANWLTSISLTGLHLGYGLISSCLQDVSNLD
jgi:hypothetical protein